MTSTTFSDQPGRAQPLDQHDPLGLTPVKEDKRQQFLSFQLFKDKGFLLPLADILEVLQIVPTEILPIPDMSDSVLGICSWRGENLWIVDLNVLMGNLSLSAQNPLQDQFSIIVVQSDAAAVGLAVNQIDDVDLVEPSQLQEQDELCSTMLAPFVKGYLPNHNGIVLEVSAIIRRLQGDSD